MLLPAVTQPVVMEHQLEKLLTAVLQRLPVPPAAAGPCVPRADAAAVEARQAAFHCDEALVGGAVNPDKEFWTRCVVG